MEIDIIRVIDRKIGIPICFFLSLLRALRIKRYKLHDLKDVKNILIIKLWGIGTIVECTPTFKAIRDKYPHAKIVFVTMSNNAGLYEDSELFDDTYYISIDNFWHVVRDGFATLFRLRRYSFDILMDLEVIARFTAILSFFISAKIKMGFNAKGQGREKMYDVRIPYEEKAHISKIMFKFAEALAIEKMPGLVSPVISPGDKTAIDALFRKNKVKRMIVININASKMALCRRWPAENYAAIAEYLLKNNHHLVFVGSKSESNYVDNTIAMIHAKNKSSNVLNLAGKITLKELTYLFERSSLFITNDSGPLHIALTTQCPTISFFGPESPILYGPIGDRHKVFYTHEFCSPCINIYNGKEINCQNNYQCILKIKPQEVIDYLKHKGL